MPELSRFLGIVISMYYRDHGPPHFHAYYGELQATVDIDAGRMNGSLPARVTAHVQEWRLLHQAELLQNWDLARDQLPLARIAPLE
jgi:hypothetical protein